VFCFKTSGLFAFISISVTKLSCRPPAVERTV
jgi:hypothetical protein